MGFHCFTWSSPLVNIWALVPLGLGQRFAPWLEVSVSGASSVMVLIGFRRISKVAKNIFLNFFKKRKKNYSFWQFNNDFILFNYSKLPFLIYITALQRNIARIKAVQRLGNVRFSFPLVYIQNYDTKAKVVLFWNTFFIIHSMHCNIQELGLPWSWCLS